MAAAAIFNVISKPRSRSADHVSKIVPLHSAQAAIDQIGSLYKRQKTKLLELYKKYPTLVEGNYKNGEIEVVTDPSMIAKIERTMEKRFLEKGKSAEDAREWSRVGVLSQDPYFINIRDAVYFPNGSTGVYNRQLERSALEGAGQGAIALPLSQDGKVLFNLTYRHATRSWGMELARGFSDKEDGNLSKTCTRELAEETGMNSAEPVPLGEVCANTGINGTRPQIFLCPLTGAGKPNRENEAIKKCIPFSQQEVADALVNGYFVYENKRIEFIDGFSMNAILKAQAAGHIHLPPGKREKSSKTLRLF